MVISVGRLTEADFSDGTPRWGRVRVKVCQTKRPIVVLIAYLIFPSDDHSMEATQDTEVGHNEIVHRRGDRFDPESVHSENLFIRNYDPYEAYDLTVSVSDTEAPVFEERYFFQPGQIETVRGVLVPGEYEVTVELDNRRRKTATCRVGDSPHQTIHVEMGNGIVSLTEGLYG
jgi:hypothetical protein